MARIKIDIDTETATRESTREALVSSVPRIGVVSTIGLDERSRDKKTEAFENGVNNSSVNIKYSPQRGYKKGDTASLRQAITIFNKTASIIVTVGGSIAYEAAKEAASIPFLSLLGAVPSTPFDKFWGGVSLESWATNAKRIEALKEKGITDVANIALFYNPNSQMSVDEIEDWKFQTGLTNTFFPGGVDSNGNNDATKYASGFAAIPSTIKGLVISADPYFQNTKEDLIKAANDWATLGRHVCYPLLTYANRAGTHKPTSGRSMLLGPKLDDAYFLLGQLAAAALGGQAPMPVLRLGNIRQDL